MRVLYACVCLVAASAFADFKEVDTFLERPEPPARQFSLPDGRVSSQEPRLGVPTFVWLDRSSDAPDLRAMGVTPEEAARRALVTHANLYGHTPSQLAEVKVSKLLDLGRGAIVVTFERRFDGRPVFHERLSVVLSQRLEPVALTGYFAPQQPKTHEWRLAPDTALAVAFEGFTGTPVSPQHFVATGFDSAGAQRFTASTLPGHSVTLARAKAVWFTGQKKLVPAWYVELDTSPHEATTAELVGTVISGIDGTVLWRRSLTQNDSYSYRVWADATTKRPHDGPYGTNTTPHPTGLRDGSALNFTAPSLVNLEHAGLSTGDPWLAPGASTLTGNNVDAYADLTAPDGFNAGDFRAPTTSAGTFDVTYDLNAAPDTASQRAAGLTQGFYVVNWLHDWFYDHGFDEAAGNAQTDNFGRGGAGGDALRLEGQDYGGTNNANMSTPADGAPPRMQMFLWSPTASVQRDGALDSSVVAHEWGHSLVQRLTDIGGTQSEGMNEGWADMVALLMTVELSDKQKAGNSQFEGAWVVGVYNSEFSVNATDALYFGLRRVPYSTSFSKNALTFRHIQDGVALPTTHPMTTRAQRNSASHNTGEVWAAMLWEGYAAMLNAQPRLSFSQAQSRMLDALVASLAATPSAATFTEARDALLAVTSASDVEDYRLMLRAFAKRGLGVRAVSPPRGNATNTPTVEDFSTVGLTVDAVTLDDDGVQFCDRDGTLDSGEDGRLRLTLRNIGADALQGATATVTANVPGVNIGTATFPAVQPWQTATAETTLRLPALTQATELVLTITVTANGLPTPVTETATFTVNVDRLPASSANDDAEGVPTAWTFAAASTPPTTFAWRHFAQTAIDHRYSGPTPVPEGDISLVSPPLVVGASAFSFTFKNRWDFEVEDTDAYDGAVIELSTNDGATWIDIGTQISPGYNATLVNGPEATNPLKGRPAFSGRSAAYPAWVTSTVSLGTTYAGQTVRVRLRIGSDDAVAKNGWEVDDFVFTGLMNTPFPTRVTDRKQCVNRPPIANAGADFTVDEGSAVTLNSSASTDADMNMLTATWTQVSGPMVTLNGNQFTAPMVTMNEVLVFALRVNDGTVDSANTDEVSVTVRNVNAPVNTAPVVNAGMNVAVEELATFTLTATANDAENDPLTYEWRQVSGPAATLGAVNAATLQGTAPEVTTNTPLVFEVKVNDGANAVTAQVTVNVRDSAAPPNRAPMVSVTAPVLVDVDQSVTAEATATDPDGDAVSVSWRQVSGADVTLSANGTRVEFRAPAAGSRVVLEATASDGTLTATAQTTIAVRSSTTTPRAVVTPEVTVESGGTVQLSAAGSTGTGTLTYEWEGARLTFDSTTAEVVNVTAPEVTMEERLSVQLRVRDSSGQVASAETFVIVKAKATTGCGCTSLSGFEPLLGLAALALLRRRRH